VVQLLADACTPALTAMPSGRFFGFVIGGTHPAALAADWLVSAWDQNCGLRSLTPAHTAVEDIATTWLVELLGLPAGCAIGYVTGATTANVTGLATGRDAVLRRAGWDVPRDGLSGGPRVRVLVGAERHDTIDLALRYLGLGAPEQVAADDQGRLRVDELQRLLETGPEGPTMVLLQAGNVHSGAFDPLAEAIAVAHRHGRLGPRRRRLSGYGRRPRPGTGTSSPDTRRPTRGPRRAQDAQRALRLRPAGRARTRGTCVRPWVSRAHT
jgi:glutamate/tyrosine decarboxylase-like PLP-dependent enzyme